MVIVNPIPGQETRNSDFLLENGAAIKVNNLGTLAFRVGELHFRPRASRPAPGQRRPIGPAAGGLRGRKTSLAALRRTIAVPPLTHASGFHASPSLTRRASTPPPRLACTVGLPRMPPHNASGFDAEILLAHASGFHASLSRSERVLCDGAFLASTCHNAFS